MVAVYRTVLAENPPGVALWIAPTHRAAVAVRQRVLARNLPGCLNPHCFSFDQFVRRLLEASEARMRPISVLGQRRILRTLVDQAIDQRRLNHFAPIAETAGFVDLLINTIGELKRLEIWPQELREAAGGLPGDKNRELVELYDAYQRVLNNHDLYDAQGRFWSARAQLRDGQRRPFESVQHIFVDGFVDFTRTEHEILEILAKRVESMTISLPLDSDARRAELFRKPAATFAELRRRHGELTVEELSPAGGRTGALRYAERSLFATRHTPGDSPRPDGIEILPAASVTHEIELVARRVKGLLIDGDDNGPVPPSDVLVVFRSIGDEIAQLVSEVFEEYGIPAAIDHRPMLESAPVVRSLIAWFECEQDDWSFRKLAPLLVSNYFRPPWPEWQNGAAAAAAEHVVRRLQSTGRLALLSQLERVSAEPIPASRDEDDASARLERDARLARPLLERLGRLFDTLPARATATEWAETIFDLAEASGMAAAIDSDDAVPHDRAAFDALLDALRETDRLAGWMGGQSAQLSLGECLNQLREIARSVVWPIATEEPGRVRVLSAENARHLSAPYVFMAGLSERAFPPAEREDCIFGEADTRRLVDAGLPMAPRALRQGHEMLLFYQVVNRAIRRLVLSYPALDDSAQPLSPSPYLNDLERTFHPHLVPRLGPPNLSTVPATDDVRSVREFRVRAAAEALNGEPRLITELAACPTTAITAQSLFAGWDAIAARAQGESFGLFEGMLMSREVRALLAQRFGQAHDWSPSQLEQYESCPFQFLLDRVLGLEEIAEPALSADYAGRGRILHWMLATLHRRLNAKSGGNATPSALLDEQFRALLNGLVEEILESRRTERPLADGLLEIDLRRVSVMLEEYHRQHEKYDAKFADFDEPPRPAHFEVAFGSQHHAAGDATSQWDLVDPISRSDPFEFVCAAETIRFSGRIDRIDIGRVGGRPVYTIIDYKSGRSESATAAAIASGKALQLPLYALAAEQLLLQSGAQPLHIGYWHPAVQGCKQAIALHEHDEGELRESLQWETLRKTLPHKVQSLVDGIRDGQFPMASSDLKCTSRCEFHTVCRVNQTRALDKQWTPPGERAE